MASAAWGVASATTECARPGEANSSVPTSISRAKHTPSEICDVACLTFPPTASSY